MMFGIVGAAIFAFGVWMWRQRRVPVGAQILSGTVVDVREHLSTATPRQTRYGPVVAYQHPATGQREILEPVTFSGRMPQRGTRVAVAYDRDNDRVLLVPQHPLAQKFALPAMGAVMVAIQVAAWTT